MLMEIVDVSPVAVLWGIVAAEFAIALEIGLDFVNT